MNLWCRSLCSLTVTNVFQETHKEIKQLIAKLEKQEELHNELIEQNKVLIEEIKKEKVEKVTMVKKPTGLPNSVSHNAFKYLFCIRWG